MPNKMAHQDPPSLATQPNSTATNLLPTSVSPRDSLTSSLTTDTVYSPFAIARLMLARPGGWSAGAWGSGTLASWLSRPRSLPGTSTRLASAVRKPQREWPVAGTLRENYYNRIPNERLR